MEIHELIFQMIKTMLEYVSTKERETAFFAVLDLIYNEDMCDLEELKSYIEYDEEDEWMAKKITVYMKENGLYEEDEDEEEDW